MTYIAAMLWFIKVDILQISPLNVKNFFFSPEQLQTASGRRNICFHSIICAFPNDIFGFRCIPNGCFLLIVARSLPTSVAAQHTETADALYFHHSFFTCFYNCVCIPVDKNVKVMPSTSHPFALFVNFFSVLPEVRHLASWPCLHWMIRTLSILVTIWAHSCETACCEDAAKARPLDKSHTVNCCPLFSPCLYGVGILQTPACCPAALSAAHCNTFIAVCDKATSNSRPPSAVQDIQENRK